MNSALMNAMAKKTEPKWRALAHELSAEWHRRVGVRLGLVSTALSAIVSTSIFAAVTATLGIDAKGSLTIPQQTAPLLCFYAVITLLIISPVFSAVQAYLNEPDQVKRHTSASAGYYRQVDRLDRVIEEYEATSPDGTPSETARKEMDDISTAMEKLRAESIPLARRAIADAKRQLNVQ